MIEPREWYYCPVCDKSYRWNEGRQMYVPACDCAYFTDDEETDDTTIPTTAADS